VKKFNVTFRENGWELMFLNMYVEFIWLYFKQMTRRYFAQLRIALYIYWCI